MTELTESGSRQAALKVCHASLARMSAEERVAWALDKLPGQHIVSSSFGAQSAVMLRLMTEQQPDIPVVVVDTGYLFPETYRFIDYLDHKLNLNLQVFSAEQSSAWQEARYGKRWEKGVAGIESYNQANKVAQTATTMPTTMAVATSPASLEPKPPLNARPTHAPPASPMTCPASSRTTSGA